MSDKNKPEHSTPSLEQLVKELDSSLQNANDPQALRLGMAALAGYDTSVQREKYILVSLGKERLAIPITHVAEVGDLPMVTRLPSVPDWVDGIINVRSDIVSVMDIRRFLNWDVGEDFRGNRMVILRNKKSKVALRIDRIIGTYNKTDDTEMEVARPRISSKNRKMLARKLTVNGVDYYALDCNAMLTNEQFVEVR